MPDNSLKTRRLWWRARAAVCAAWARLRDVLGICWNSARFVGSAVVPVGTLLAGLAAAIAAYESREAVNSVSSIEHRRLVYEQSRLAVEMYQRYADFIKTAPPIRLCLPALQRLDDSDFVALLDAPDKLKFQHELPTHVALSQCLPKEEDRRLYKDSPEKWGIEQSKSAGGTIWIWLNQYDAYFLAFTYQVGNPGILCKNMMGIFDAAHQHPIRGLLVRMNAHGLLRHEEYVKQFLEGYAAEKACPSTHIELEAAPGFFVRFMKAMGL